MCTVGCPPASERNSVRSFSTVGRIYIHIYIYIGSNDAQGGWNAQVDCWTLWLRISTNFTCFFLLLYSLFSNIPAFLCEICMGSEGFSDDCLVSVTKPTYYKIGSKCAVRRYDATISLHNVINNRIKNKIRLSTSNYDQHKEY